MALLATLMASIPLVGGGDRTEGVDSLKAALREPRKDVALYGVYEEPRLDPLGANTAVFPVTVYDADTGEPYRETEVEFAIESDEGKERLEAFLREHDIEGRQDLDAIEGLTADVERTDDGNITVNW